MSEKPIYIITFDSANNSMLLYRLLKSNKLNIYMIQTPCCLSAGCARSIEVDESEIEKVIEFDSIIDSIEYVSIDDNIKYKIE